MTAEPRKPVPPRETDFDRFLRLLHASHPCIFIQTLDESHATDVVRKAALDRRLHLKAWKHSRGIYDADFADGSSVADTEHPAAALHHLNGSDLTDTLVLCLDLVEHLSEARTLRLLRDLIENLRKKNGHLVLVDVRAGLPASIEHESTCFETTLPDDKELGELVRDVLSRERGRLKGAVRVPADVWASFLHNLAGLTRRQARQVVLDVISDDGILDQADLNHALARKRQILHKDGLLEFIETPATLDEIAGMGRLKTWLAHRKNSLMEEARLYGLAPPRGILMLGVPGSGKSLCAKAVASAWHRPLFRLDPSVLYDKYIGESEGNLRQTLRQAEGVAPIILWIDEIEKGFAGAASRSVDGGLSQRMFGTLLTWLQEHQAPVFVIATANDIEALPPELLRKGRFDEIFFVDLPTPDVRREILAIHLKKRLYNPSDFDLAALVQVSEGYTGSEIEQAVLASMQEVFSLNRKMATPDLVEAFRRSPPLSVTMKERVDSLREWARGRCATVE